MNRVICCAPGQDKLMAICDVLDRPTGASKPSNKGGTPLRDVDSTSVKYVYLVTLVRLEECVRSNILKTRIHHTCLSHLCGMGIEMRHSGKCPRIFAPFYRNVDVLISPNGGKIVSLK
ncbi:hypothetical protein PS1_014785 [Malus domestica]